MTRQMVFTLVREVPRRGCLVRSLRRVRSLTPLCAAVLALAGCGATVVTTTPAHSYERVSISVLKRALTTTLEQRSFRVLSKETAQIGGNTVSALSANGVEAHVSNDPSAAFSLTLPAPVGAVRALLIHHQEYLSVPVSLTGTLPPSISWIVLNPGAIANSALGAGASQLFSGSESNPSALLGDLKGLVGTTASVLASAVQVDGTRTTEYGASLNLVKALRLSGTATSAATLRRVAQTLGSGEMPCQVWVDHSGRIRELRLRINTRLAAHQQARIVEVLNLSNFGVPVNVAAPPSSTVERLPGLSGVAQG